MNNNRILWTCFIVIAIVVVALLGMTIHKLLMGDEVTTNAWCFITIAACSLMNTYYILSHNQKQL
jgi:hypothetical protein